VCEPIPELYKKISKLSHHHFIFTKIYHLFIHDGHPSWCANPSLNSNEFFKTSTIQSSRSDFFSFPRVCQPTRKKVQRKLSCNSVPYYILKFNLPSFPIKPTSFPILQLNFPTFTSLNTRKKNKSSSHFVSYSKYILSYNPTMQHSYVPTLPRSLPARRTSAYFATFSNPNRFLPYFPSFQFKHMTSLRTK